MVQPVCPQLRKGCGREASYAWCQLQTPRSRRATLGSGMEPPGWLLRDCGEYRCMIRHEPNRLGTIVKDKLSPVGGSGMRASRACRRCRL